jgi:hypothetical protein
MWISDWLLDLFASLTITANHFKALLQQQLPLVVHLSLSVPLVPTGPTLPASPSKQLSCLGSRTQTKQLELEVQ